MATPRRLTGAATHPARASSGAFIEHLFAAQVKRLQAEHLTLNSPQAVRLNAIFNQGIACLLFVAAAPTPSGSGGGAGAAGLVLLAVAALAYFIPAIAAGARRNVNAGGVFVVNLFLGWTVLGWVIALAMAFGGARRPAPALSVGQRSEDGRWWWDGQQWRPLPPP